MATIVPPEKLKNIPIDKVRTYLDMNLFNKSATRHDIEQWVHRDGRCVNLDVSENSPTPLAIISMLKEMNQPVESFLKIISVIN